MVEKKKKKTEKNRTQREKSSHCLFHQSMMRDDDAEFTKHLVMWEFRD